MYLSLSKLPPNCDTSGRNTQIILKNFHTSYIFKVNRLTRCALDAVYKKFLPTFLGAFLMLLSNFKNLRIQQASANLQQVIEELLNWS